MINNLKVIEPLLNFEKEGDFYMLYIMARKKDMGKQKSNHQSVRTIKTYCIQSSEYLYKRWEEITQLCEIFKARAYIHVQKQNHHDVSLEMMISLATRIKNGQHNQKGLFESVVGQLKTLEKRWVVDIDTKDVDYITEVQMFINNQCRPLGEKIIANITTKSGYHLITEKFDVMTFRQKYPEIDIQKKNPTLLYLPESLSND